MVFAADKSAPLKGGVTVFTLSVLVLALALSQEAAAQRDDALYFELAGNGGVFSVNYDRAIVEGLSQGARPALLPLHPRAERALGEIECRRHSDYRGIPSSSWGVWGVRGVGAKSAALRVATTPAPAAAPASARYTSSKSESGV